MVGVERDPYEGPVAQVNAAAPPPTAASATNPLAPQQVTDDTFHARQTKSGVRHLQESSFSLGGECVFKSAEQLVFVSSAVLPLPALQEGGISSCACGFQKLKSKKPVDVGVGVLAK